MEQYENLPTTTLLAGLKMLVKISKLYLESIMANSKPLRACSVHRNILLCLQKATCTCHKAGKKLCAHAVVIKAALTLWKRQYKLNYSNIGAVRLR